MIDDDDPMAVAARVPLEPAEKAGDEEEEDELNPDGSKKGESPNRTLDGRKGAPVPIVGLLLLALLFLIFATPQGARLFRFTETAVQRLQDCPLAGQVLGEPFGVASFGFALAVPFGGVRYSRHLGGYGILPVHGPKGRGSYHFTIVQAVGGLEISGTLSVGDDDIDIARCTR